MKFVFPNATCVQGDSWSIYAAYPTNTSVFNYCYTNFITLDDCYAGTNSDDVPSDSCIPVSSYEADCIAGEYYIETSTSLPPYPANTVYVEEYTLETCGESGVSGYLALESSALGTCLYEANCNIFLNCQSNDIIVTDDGKNVTFYDSNDGSCSGGVSLDGEKQLLTCEYASNFATEANVDRLSYATGFNITTYYLTPPTSSSPSSSGFCFAGSETVVMESKETKAIEDVVVGDRILTADSLGILSFASVIAVPHDKNDIVANFVKITVDGLRDIKITTEHLLPFSISCLASDFEITMASKVLIGGCLQTVDGLAVISSIESVQSRGIYSVVTENDYIVVNGIVASPFAVNHASASIFYNGIEMINNMFPGFLAGKSVVSDLYKSFSTLVMQLS